MKRKLILLLLFVFIGVLLNQEKVYGDEPVTIPTSISVSYSGGSVLVGQEYDSSALEVTATYQDGSTKVVTDYTTSSKIVRVDGSNLFTVVYYGKAAQFYVTGKTLKSITAMYVGGAVFSVGNKVPSKDISVQAEYSDGTGGVVPSTGCSISQAVISNAGSNTVRVTYQGKTATFEVFGVQAREVNSISAVYAGAAKIVGAALNEDDILVTAVYADGSTEQIYNFTISPPKISAIGSNTFTIAFRGKTATITVTGTEKKIVSITAKYTGGNVVVGKSVREKDVVVTAVYNDGSTGTETEFTLLNNGRVGSIGSNLITVDAGGAKAEFTVTGVAASPADLAAAPKYPVANSKRAASLLVALPDGYNSGDLAVESLELALVKRLVARELRNGDYIPFSLQFSDLDLDIEVPFTAQITIPKEYAVSGCSVYYTPNRKSVMGVVNIDVISTTVVQFDIFNEGTYILAYNPDWNKK